MEHAAHVIRLEEATVINKPPPTISSASYSRADQILENLFTSKDNCDVTFVVGDQEFPAHKAILAARSPVFAAMFQHDMKERALNRVDIVDIEPGIFQALLLFIYTDQVDLAVRNHGALLKAANRYLVDLLKLKCETILVKKISSGNWYNCLTFAERNNSNNLKRAIVDFLRMQHSSLPKILKDDEWKQLKIDHPQLAIEILEKLSIASK